MRLVIIKMKIMAGISADSSGYGSEILKLSRPVFAEQQSPRAGFVTGELKPVHDKDLELRVLPEIISGGTSGGSGTDYDNIVWLIMHVINACLVLIP
jgi:hypothetical protein